MCLQVFQNNHSRILSKIPNLERSQTLEWFGLIPILNSGDLGEFQILSRGSENQVWLKPRQLFHPLFRQDCLGFYVFHNHPSGSLRPSTADILITQHIIRLSHQLEFEFMGHAIVTKTRHFWIQTESYDTEELHEN